MDKPLTTQDFLEHLRTTSTRRLNSWPRFLKLWPKTREALDQGYSIIDVHSALLSSGEWRSGYDVFRKLVARARRSEAIAELTDQRC